MTKVIVILILFVISLLPIAFVAWMIMLMRRRGHGPSLRSLGVTFVLVGGSFSLVAAGMALHSVHFKLTGQRTIGSVTELRSAGNGNFSPVFVFTNYAQRFEVVSRHSSKPPSHSVGDIIPVLFDPANPQKARPDTFQYSWLLPTIFGGAGGGLLVIGVAILILKNRWLTPPAAC
jgi:hypothetical protein